MSGLASHEVEREARRVLRQLGVARTALVALERDCFAVTRNAKAAQASRVRVAGNLVRAFVARGWIASDGPGRFVRSEAGALFLAASQGVCDPHGDRHRLMQDAVITGPGGAVQPVRINRAESPLARLAFRGLLDPVQFAAGEKLRRDFTLSQMSPRMGVDLSAPVVSGRRGGGGDNVSDIALAARQRLSRALVAAGPGLGDLAFDVCCHLMALELAEMRRNWSKRSGRTVLKIALDRLAEHYGLGVKAPSHARLRGWRMEAAEQP